METTAYNGEIPSVNVDTSVAAAHQITAHAKTVRDWVLKQIQAAGENGMTDDELVASYGASHHNTIAPRRRELVLMGFVKDGSGRRLTRQGRHAIVWVPSL